MTLNWKFVKQGKGVKFMLCNGDELIKEFSKDNCPGGMLLEYSLLHENQLLKEGSKIQPTIAEYIKQCNYNAENRDNQKTDIVVMSIYDWKRMQKEVDKNKKK
jgi:hypothetical protein